jgi:hypothetical protein
LGRPRGDESGSRLHSLFCGWSGRPDLNRGPLAPKISPTHLNACVSNAPCAKVPPDAPSFVPICSQPNERPAVAEGRSQTPVRIVQKGSREFPNSRAHRTTAEAVRLETERFARRLCRRYPEAFTHPNATLSKEEVIRQIRIALPPHPGRPRKANVTHACELKDCATPWREIYAQCIPGYVALQWGERRMEIARLRNAVRARRLPDRGRARKNPHAISHQERNDAALFAPTDPDTLTA